MKIQFHHRRIVKQTIYSNEIAQTITTEIKAKGGTTIALQVPSVEQFDEFRITDPKIVDYKISTIKLDVGMSKCSNADNYNKTLGRRISKGRMKTVVFWARKYSEDEVVLVATDSKHKLPKLILRKSPKGGRVYLIGTK